LQDRDTALRQLPGKHPRCHFFSTFFLNKLYKDEKRYNYKNVSTAAVPACFLVTFFPKHRGVCRFSVSATQRRFTIQ
jgi:hypothetical protein